MTNLGGNRLGEERKEPKLLFRTVVNDKVMGVYSRKETHELGKNNGKPDSWWLKLEYEKQFEWVPWIDIGTSRPCWEISIKQVNRTKYKWDEHQIHRTGSVVLICNKRPVYEFGFGDLGYAFSKAQQLTTQLLEHPFNFTDPESEVGRKVWWNDQPAIIDSLIMDQGCVMIRHEEPGKKLELTEISKRKPNDLSLR